MNPNEPQQMPPAGMPPQQPASPPPPQPVAPQPPNQQPPVGPQPPINPNTMPVQQPVAPMTPPGGGRSKKKLAIIIGAVVGGVLLLAAAAFLIIGMLGGGVPKYSETTTVELSGPSGTENRGIKFAVPVEMKEDKKTGTDAEYYDYLDDENKEKGWYGLVAGSVETLPTTRSEEQKDQVKQSIVAAFNSGEFDDQISSSAGSDARNFNVTNKTVTDDNTKLSADVDLEVKSTDDEYVPAKGVIHFFVEEGALYVYGYFFTDQVYDANQEFIDSLDDSVELNV